MGGGADFDPTGRYRYRLWREWDAALPVVAFVMLNPSTANAEQDDPTIRRCLGFARAWGFGRLEVVNLFAYRASAPRELFAANDPVGPENDGWIERVVVGSGTVVAAWGNAGRWRGRSREVLARLGEPLVLGLTRLGEPRHPLYVRRQISPSPAAQYTPGPCCTAAMVVTAVASSVSYGTPGSRAETGQAPTR